MGGWLLVNRFPLAAFAAFGLAAALSVATPAQATVTFASYGAAPNSATNMTWTNIGLPSGTLANAPGDADFETAVTDTSFSFLSFGLPTDLNADFTLTATSTSAAAVAFGVLLAQPGISGSFQFTYDGPTNVINGVLFTTGANLLSGTFNNAFISGVSGGAVGSAQAEIATLGPVTFASDFLTFQNPCCGDETISIALNSIDPVLRIGPNGVLASFNSSTTGNFSADVVVPNTSSVPEPATWSMMWIGFAFVGGAMRSGRKMAPLHGDPTLRNNR